MKRMKIVALVLVLLAAAMLLSACGGGETDSAEAKKLSFKSASSYDDLKALNNGEAMQKEMDALYMEFADWLASWEV